MTILDETFDKTYRLFKDDLYETKKELIVNPVPANSMVIVEPSVQCAMLAFVFDN